MRTPLASPGPAALAVALIFLLGACSQNEFSEKGPAAPAPVNPPPAKRILKVDAGGAMQAPAEPTPEPADVHYTGTVELPAGGDDAPKPGMVLFVIARAAGGDGTSPLAARRIGELEALSFPVSFELCGAESMTGEPLPPTAEILARLDGDGDIATSQAGDLVADPVPVRSGEPVRLVLRKAGR